MTIDELKALVSGGESENVEFKKSTALLNSAMQTLCAFLNNNGGIVLIGVTDNLKIIGQMINDGTKKEIAQDINRIEPKPDIKVEYLKIGEEKFIILLEVAKGHRAPYVYDGRAFHRLQSATMRMTQEEYEKLLFNRKPITNYWEELKANGFSLEDLDKNLIRQVVSTAIREKRLTDIATNDNIKVILKKLKLINGDELNNAAVVLFCKKNDKQFMQCHLKLARFRGIDKREFIDNKRIVGNAFELYEQGLKFLNNYLPVAAKIEVGNPQRVEKPAIPYDVLREALANAICHRDYSYTGGAINIAIYDNRVVISSIGRLPSDIKLSDLTKEHESHPRNPLIAKVFYLCKLIEQWGRGTEDIVKISVELGNPKPIFEESTGDFSVIFPLREPIGGYKQTEKYSFTERQKKILKIIEEKSSSSSEIKEKINANVSLRSIQVELNSLEKMGVIQREGAGKYVVWKMFK